MSSEQKPDFKVEVNVNVGQNGKKELESRLDPDYETINSEAKRLEAELNLARRKAELDEQNFGRFKPLEREVREYEDAFKSNPDGVYLSGVCHIGNLNKIEERFGELQREEKKLFDSCRTATERKSAELRLERLKGIGEKMDEIKKQVYGYIQLKSDCSANAYKRQVRAQRHNNIMGCLVPILFFGGIALLGKTLYDAHLDVASAVDRQFSVGRVEKPKDFFDKVKPFAFDSEDTKQGFIRYVRALVEEQPEFRKYTDTFMPEKVIVGLFRAVLGGFKDYEPALSALVSNVTREMDDSALYSENMITDKELEQAKQQRYKFKAIVKEYINSGDFARRMKL